MPTATKEVIISNKLGLHARPAMQFVDLANRFTSDILVHKAGEEPADADGKSVMQMIILAAVEGTPLLIEAKGEDADEALRGSANWWRVGSARNKIVGRVFAAGASIAARAQVVSPLGWREIETKGRACSAAISLRAADSLLADDSRAPTVRGEFRAFMEIRKGIGVSPGVAISTAIVLDAEDLAVPRRQLAPGDVPAEIERFKKAIDQSAAEVEAAQQRHDARTAKMSPAFSNFT